MKKIFLTIISFLMIPNFVFAYSDYIIPGGENLGIKVNSDGVMIVGFYKINGKYNKSDLKIGDYILKIEKENVTTLEELTKAIEKNMTKKTINITYRRNNKIKNGSLNLIFDDDIYKTGLYVKDNVTGCGTLTYIDDTTKIFAALGHEITLQETNSLIEIKDGSIFYSLVSSITKSTDGIPGSKNATYDLNKVYGNIVKNTSMGIYGKYTYELPNKAKMKVASKDEVKIGPATIYTTLDDNQVLEYAINITNINETTQTKNITFDITDENLLNKTGGIIQGMSGSPIIQNNKIIGAVTHVKINNVKSGYGIFITTMLEEGEK